VLLESFPPRYFCRHVLAGVAAHGLVTTRSLHRLDLRLHVSVRLCFECTRELLELLELEHVRDFEH
jgi:hypothetical protein